MINNLTSGLSQGSGLIDGKKKTASGFSVNFVEKTFANNAASSLKLVTKRAEVIKGEDEVFVKFREAFFASDRRP